MIRRALLISLVLGCDTQPTAPTAPTPPAAGAAPADPAADSVSGLILETMDAGGYTYLKLQLASGEQWAAIPQTSLTVGNTITLTNPAMMTHFESPTLGRTFDTILFATVANSHAASPHDAAAAPSSAASADLPPGHPAIETGGSAVKADIPKASGEHGLRVAEVYAQMAALSGQTVAVTGQVTKYNGGIMGRNWIHLQDGSGSTGTNDLTFTSSDSAAVGDIVTITGTVATDKDFGAGYKYTVIVEDSSISQ